MSGGYLRRNGVPYSENATLEEYFDTFTEPNGDTWLVVTAIVTDPQIPDPAVHVDRPVQEDSRSLGMGSDALPGRTNPITRNSEVRRKSDRPLMAVHSH